MTAADFKVPSSYEWHETEPVVAPAAAHPLAPEDPFVWLSRRGFHALFHHRSCSSPGHKGSRVDCGGAHTAARRPLSWLQTVAALDSLELPQGLPSQPPAKRGTTPTWTAPHTHRR